MKKNIHLIIVIALFASTLTACKTQKLQKEDTAKANVETLSGSLELKDIKFPINLELQWGEAFNHPTFAIWVEDMEGNYLQTLFVTKSIATGIFGYSQASDSTWSPEEGKSYRPAALPVWFHKKGFLKDGTLVPTPKNQFLDAVVGATPKQDVRLKSGTKEKPAAKFRVVLEINQTWDWNEYYHNNLYPENRDYKSSAQPSLVYAVTVDLQSSFNTFYMNPIGHGHFAGADGLLYTDLSKHTTALDIIEKAIVKISH